MTVLANQTTTTNDREGQTEKMFTHICVPNCIRRMGYGNAKNSE